MYGIDEIKTKDDQATIVVGNNTVWQYHNKRWLNIQGITAFQDYNWHTFEVFQDNQKIGDYSLWYDDRWYIFDQDKNPISIEGSLLAYEANYDLAVSAFLEQKISDYKPVEKVLSKYGIDTSSKFSNSLQISFDIDQDGEMEEFYLITNAFALDFSPDVLFSFVFMVKNDEIYMIYENTEQSSIYNTCKPYFTSFLDVNRDHNYEIILSCGRYSIEKEIQWLYEFRDNQFKILISNE
jgi:hypothetical protein